ncbi:hypothetical protein [Synechococcus sp. PCC 6312]|uniref:hypothetical protein n=1 Tax=Synechococcus sp. (strain ATCC 27167 / PCC 6312) TaxID=195253 RepID=UPI00029EE9C3|nr:hypothetical protein [Synechococcus sp. PCC 6312]AFY61941.1 hypothetical protein Syn6312_2877 [Synechococcus sp. PCC 6312]
MELIEFLKSLDVPKSLTPEEKKTGIAQMIDDLERMAKNDGCIAAGYVLDVLEYVAKKK